MVLLIVQSLPLFSQWVNDPSVNTLIGSGAQLECPMIATDPYGNSFVSYWKSINGFYNLRLQKVDIDGIPLWGPEGMLISNQDTVQTFTTYYDVGIDREGNTLLIYEDSRSGDADMYAYKVSPAGNMLWGVNGIRLSNGASFDLLPSMVVLKDNSVVFAWQTEDSAGIIIQKLTPGGIKLWGPDGILLYHQPNDPLPYYSYPKLVNCDESSFFLVYEKADASCISSVQSLSIQRYDSNGQPMWNNEVIFQNIGSLPIILRLNAIPDLQQGCIISWLDARINNFTFEGYVQRIDQNGNMLYPQNGMMTINPNPFNFNDIVCLTDFAGNIYAFHSSASTLTGQKISPAGTLLWGNQGILFDSLSNSNVQVSQLEAVKIGSYNLVKYNRDSMITGKIKAILVNESGTQVWPTLSIDVANSNSFKMWSCASGFIANQVVVAWADDRNAGVSNIYAQNILPDGNIGPLAIPKVEKTNFNIYPNPVTDWLTIDRGDLTGVPCQVELYNSSGQLVLQEKSNETRLMKIEVSKVKRGVYTLIIKSKESVEINKVIIL